MQATARLGGLVGRDLVEVTDDLSVLDRAGRWAVVLPYVGPPVLARFARWEPASAAEIAGPWRGPSSWSSSMTEQDYCEAVSWIRREIATGRVYQANLCRILSGRLPDGESVDIAGLHALLDRQHPAPFSAMIRLPDHDVHVASASPELFLRRRGEQITSAPIKGTATHEGALLDKDRAENVMIVDLMRHDFSRVCRPGSVAVPQLMRSEHHPGLVHLVSTVTGVLQPDVTWGDVVAATFPPGSVTGAPKHTALQVITETEPQPRGPYCGAMGWVDADAGEAELAVSIRTFWRQGDTVHFGTGAGITWGSDPHGEWTETQIKARRLLSVASEAWVPVEEEYR